jgi:hypothetical protein
MVFIRHVADYHGRSLSRYCCGAVIQSATIAKVPTSKATVCDVTLCCISLFVDDVSTQRPLLVHTCSPFACRLQEKMEPIIELFATGTVAVVALSGAVIGLLWLPRAFHHLCTAAAVLVLSTLVALVGPHIFNSWAQMAMSTELPPPLSLVTKHVRPIATANVLSVADVLSVSLLFYIAYGVVVIVRRLVDTIRILKVSRRRLVFYSGPLLGPSGSAAK